MAEVWPGPWHTAGAGLLSLLSVRVVPILTTSPGAPREGAGASVRPAQVPDAPGPRRGALRDQHGRLQPPHRPRLTRPQVLQQWHLMYQHLYLGKTGQYTIQNKNIKIT